MGIEAFSWADDGDMRRVCDFKGTLSSRGGIVALAVRIVSLGLENTLC